MLDRAAGVALVADIHLVASNSAASSLGVAVRELGLQGKVFCIMDALDVGPLSDGRERVAFWRSLAAPGYDDGLPLEAWDDAFAPWHELRRLVAADKPQRLLIWASQSGADYVHSTNGVSLAGGEEYRLVACSRPSGWRISRGRSSPARGAGGVCVEGCCASAGGGDSYGAGVSLHRGAN
jgi:hypothetical protein